MTDKARRAKSAIYVPNVSAHIQRPWRSNLQVSSLQSANLAILIRVRQRGWLT